MHPVDLFVSQARARGLSPVDYSTSESNPLTTSDGKTVKGDLFKSWFGELRFKEACEKREPSNIPGFATYKKKDGWVLGDHFYSVSDRNVYLNVDVSDVVMREPDPGEVDQMKADLLLHLDQTPIHGDYVRVGTQDTLVLSEPKERVSAFGMSYYMPIVLLSGKHTPVPAGWIVKV